MIRSVIRRLSAVSSRLAVEPRHVEVDDPAAYLQKAEQLGGQTIVPPTTIEQFGLTFAFFADPEGHVVGLSQGAVQ